MTALAHYRKSYEQLSGFVVSMAILVTICSLISGGINLWLHQPWRTCLNAIAFVGFVPTLFRHGVVYLQAKWKHPAVWIQDETLYAISPLHFRMRMDDIAGWRVADRFWLTRYYTFVLLTDHKGKTRSIGLAFVADKARFLAWLEHLLGPQTEVTTAAATA